MVNLSVSEQMKQILEQYGDKAHEAIDEAAEESAKSCVQQLKNTSPKRPKHGEYARSWAVKEERAGLHTGYIVYNKKHYQLTHLLENGHVIKNKKGTYGRTHPIKHIGPAEDAGIQRFDLGVRARLRGL